MQVCFKPPYPIMLSSASHSQFLPDIPLVFLLSMSAPSPSSFIRTAFPRRTLQLLRVDVHTAPSGTDVVESVIEKVRETGR